MSPTSLTASSWTPPDVRPAAPRDRLVDVLRTVAIAAVVLQHWLFPVVAHDGATGTLAIGNALASPWAWTTTWVGQVMPLVFFAGGAANAMGWRRRRGTGAAWLGTRVRRLAWPVLPLAAVWLPLPHLLVHLGVPPQPVEAAAQLAGQLLWFLAAYLLAVVATPWAVRLHDRFGWRAPASLAVGAAAVDVARFTTTPAVGYLNVALVWLAVHQIGIAYAAGSLERVRGSRAVGFAVAGLVITAGLVVVGPYPPSMIGLPGASTSNVNPPTVVLLALAVAQLGVVLAAREHIVSWSDRPRVSRALAWASPRSMSIYLWHMPALAVVVGVVVVAVGISTPEPGSPAWWIGAPLWLGLLAAVLGTVVRVVARFEHPPRLITATRRDQVGLATACAGAGLLGITLVGFGRPVVSAMACAAVAVGVLATLRLAPPRPRAAAPWPTVLDPRTLGA